MAIPNYQEFFKPLLEICSEGETYSPSELAPTAAEKFCLIEEDLQEMLPSGTQSRLLNRVNWAVYKLYRAGLMDKPKRGRYRISEEGREVLRRSPETIDESFLGQYPSYQEFIRITREGGRNSRGEAVEAITESSATPLEAIEQAHDALQRSLVAEIIDQLRRVDPYRFERIVLDLLLAMGYGGSRAEAARVTRASGDGGIDGIINEDRLGLETIYVQAKRFQATVPIGQVRDFAGALLGQRARKGIFITTSDFPQSAKDYVGNIDQKIILIDGRRLAELMLQHTVGVAVKQAFEVKELDSDYFEEG